MKKFVFELQKILEFRDFEKKQAEAELAKAIAAENEINSQLEQIAIQYKVSKDSVKGSFDFNDIISHSRYVNLLDFQKEELFKRLTQAKIFTDQKREVLKECMKKTTALEKLREQQFKQYREAEAYEEAELMDELATTRHMMR